MSSGLYIRSAVSNYNSQTFTIRRSTDGYYWSGGSSFVSGAAPTPSSMSVLGSGFLSNVYKADVSTVFFLSGSYSVHIYTSGTNTFVDNLTFKV